MTYEALQLGGELKERMSFYFLFFFLLGGSKKERVWSRRVERVGKEE